MPIVTDFVIFYNQGVPNHSILLSISDITVDDYFRRALVKLWPLGAH